VKITGVLPEVVHHFCKTADNASEHFFLVLIDESGKGAAKDYEDLVEKVIIDVFSC
jgi:hypothetical protein